MKQLFSSRSNFCGDKAMKRQFSCRCTIVPVCVRVCHLRVCYDVYMIVYVSVFVSCVRILVSLCSCVLAFLRSCVLLFVFVFVPVFMFVFMFIFKFIFVPDNKSLNIPEVVLVRRWTVGVLGVWREGVGWVKGGANGVSLQAT
jgi:hypothetical protein